MENSPKQDKSETCDKKIFIIGSQIGSCPICKQTKKLLLLRFGLTLCEECLLVCMNILEQIEFGISKKPEKKSHHKISKRINTKKVNSATKPRISRTAKNEEAKLH